jgi:hypothetical protein
MATLEYYLPLGVGSLIVLVGNNFVPGESILLWLDRSVAPVGYHGEYLATTFADENGFFRSPVLTIPNVDPGEHNLTAVGSTDEAGIWINVNAIHGG